MQTNLQAIIRKNKPTNLQTAIIVMAVLTYLKKPTFQAIRKVNLRVAIDMEAAVIIQEIKRTKTID